MNALDAAVASIASGADGADDADEPCIDWSKQLPHLGLTMTLLLLIYSNNGEMGGKELWKSLAQFGIKDPKKHPIFGNVEDFVEKTLIKQKYLVKFQRMDTEKPETDYRCVQSIWMIGCILCVLEDLSCGSFDATLTQPLTLTQTCGSFDAKWLEVNTRFSQHRLQHVYCVDLFLLRWRRRSTSLCSPIPLSIPFCVRRRWGQRAQAEYSEKHLLSFGAELYGERVDDWMERLGKQRGETGDDDDDDDN
jgi:hypothetical protein